MDLNKLLKKIKEGKATPEEQRLLPQWFEDLDLLKEKQPFADSEDEHAVKDKIKKRIEQQLASRGKLRMIRTAKVAAIFIVALGTGTLVYQLSKPASNTAEISKAVAKNSTIHPGEKRAIIHLENGLSIPIETDTDPNDLIKYGLQLTKEYLSIIPTNNTGMNYAIETPVGGEYRVKLSDGTMVWLNARSRLHFPARFSASSRVVKAEGEIYFEVSANPHHPFSVATNGQQVDVLGTKFLINTHGGKNNIITTLFEGKIKLRQGKKTVLMKPGEISRINVKKHTMTLSPEENITQSIAWTQGYFDFTGADFESIVKQVENWYNVQFIDLPQSADPFYGKISRSSNIHEILRMLEIVSGVRFKIEGRNIYIIK